MREGGGGELIMPRPGTAVVGASDGWNAAVAADWMGDVGGSSNRSKRSFVALLGPVLLAAG